MKSTIKKIYLENFKKFQKYTLKPNKKVNILVGDNESGKSSIIEAIDLVASGNIRRVESIGLDKLLNVDSIKMFNEGERVFEKLPILKVEIYLNDGHEFSMNGENNTDGIACDGIRLICEPNEDYRSEIKAALEENLQYFPYEYYSIRFSTFSDEGYSGYKKKLRSLLINSSNMSSSYATNDFVKRIYRQYTEDDEKERIKHKSCYRQLRNRFGMDTLKNLNEKVSKDKNYSFGLKSGPSMDMETDLMIYEEDVSIDDKGEGRQVFIKTDFALERANKNIDVILIEEPENHLSPVNLKKLIARIEDSQDEQLFITTHSSLISARLELRNLLIMHPDSSNEVLKLDNLDEETAKYFVKTPPANIIEYILSQKAILVEGPSEYMLFDKFYSTITGKTPEQENVNIIDVRGLSFKRYLNVAKKVGCKVAVVTDNDGNYQNNCIDKYEDYCDGNMKIFFNRDDSKTTFEKVLYSDNFELCDAVFDCEDVCKYMLNNKTEAAYQLLSRDHRITVPEYIKEAIEWIRQ